jgi:hypothetical protein
MAQHPFQRGQGLVEYSLIILLVVIATAGILALLAVVVGLVFRNVLHAVVGPVPLSRDRHAA